MTDRIVSPDQIPAKSVARFWHYVDKRGPDECWPWIGGRFKSGYGMLGVDGKLYGAHRISFFIHKGPLPTDKPFVCHTCNNPKCVNPAHLYADDNAGNTRYSVECGRRASGDKNGSRLYPERYPRGDQSGPHLHPERMARGLRNGKYTHPEKTPRGEANGESKLTEDQVRQIRALHATGKHSYNNLARQFNVSKSLIFYVVKRLGWKHVV